MTFVRDILRGFALIVLIAGFVGYVFLLAYSLEHGIWWLAVLLSVPGFLSVCWFFGHALQG